MKITKSELKKLVKEEIQRLNEVDLDAIKLPSNYKKYYAKN